MIEISVLGMASVILYVMVKQHKPEYAVLVLLGGGSLLLLSLLPRVREVIDFAEGVFDAASLDRDVFVLLVKALGVTILTQLAADISRDSGVSALASKIELAGRAVILVMTLPLVRALIELVMGLIEA